MDAGQVRGHLVKRIWLEPRPTIHPAVTTAIGGFDAVVIGPGSFWTSLMPPLYVEGVANAIGALDGPIVLIANLLTEGGGMRGYTAGDAARQVADVIKRPVDVIIANNALPSQRRSGTLRLGAQDASASRRRARGL